MIVHASRVTGVPTPGSLDTRVHHVQPGQGFLVFSEGSERYMSVGASGEGPLTSSALREWPRPDLVRVSRKLSQLLWFPEHQGPHQAQRAEFYSDVSDVAKMLGGSTTEHHTWLFLIDKKARESSDSLRHWEREKQKNRENAQRNGQIVSQIL